MTLRHRGPGHIEVWSGPRLVATIRYQRHLLCPDCPDDGHWTVNGRGHWHRAVHAFRHILDEQTDRLDIT